MACQESSIKVGDVINKELLEILNCQLNRLQLVESNKIGATRLVPKVEEVGGTQGVPAQAHHSALLGLPNLDKDADHQTCQHHGNARVETGEGVSYWATGCR